MNHSMELMDETDATKVVMSALENDWDKLISDEEKYWLSTTSSTPKE